METVEPLGVFGVDGVEKYKTQYRMSFRCSVDKLHIFFTDYVYVSNKSQGTFALCPVHNEFVEVSGKEK